MIYFFTPYSFNFKLLDAISGCIELLKLDDWAVIMDGDTMFLQPDFGHQIQQHIETIRKQGSLHASLPGATTLIIEILCVT